MKNIVLSLVIVAALVVAGVGGAFAHFVDSETSEDNVFELGSLNLLVNGEEDAEWGDGVGQIFNEVCAKPGTPYYSNNITVENVGSCNSGTLLLNLKQFKCYNAEPICPEAVLYQGPDGKMKEEPELVTEFGGKVDGTYVKGIGVQGDNCCMGGHTYIKIWYDGTLVAGAEDWIGQDARTIGDIADIPIKLGALPSCGEDHFVQIGLMLPDFIDTDWQGAKMFAGWPTNAFMLDGVKFDVEFDLVSEDWEDQISMDY